MNKQNLKVKVATINPGQKSQYHILCAVEKVGKHEELIPLHYAPTWKTVRGAERYAEKNGYKLLKK